MTCTSDAARRKRCTSVDLYVSATVSKPASMSAICAALAAGLLRTCATKRSSAYESARRSLSVKSTLFSGDCSTAESTMSSKLTARRWSCARAAAAASAFSKRSDPKPFARTACRKEGTEGSGRLPPELSSSNSERSIFGGQGLLQDVGEDSPRASTGSTVLTVGVVGLWAGLANARLSGLSGRGGRRLG